MILTSPLKYNFIKFVLFLFLLLQVYAIMDLNSGGRLSEMETLLFENVRFDKVLNRYCVHDFIRSKQRGIKVVIFVFII